MLILALFSLKILDIILAKKYGLGTPVIYKYSNVVGYEIKPNQKLNRLGNIIEINKYGMRSSNWKDDIPNKILFFGDSVTYGGSIVSNNDLFSENVCKILNENEKKKFTCGNYGVNGYNLDAISRKIKFKNKNQEPDLIIITLVANDLIRGFHHIISQPFWSKEIKNIYPALSEAFFIYLDSFRYKSKYLFYKQPIRDQLDYYQFIVENFSSILENSGYEYIILYSPEKDELLKNSDQYLLLKDLLKKKTQNFYNLSNYLKKRDEDIYYDGVHLNKNGHKKYSEIISKIIISENYDFK